jgi:uncharacterized protein (DUF2336 family)
MVLRQSLISELEIAIQNGSKDKRVDTLRRVTDLFLTGADRFTEDQIDVFDDVLGHLIRRIEDKALAELSERLAPVETAPIEIIRRLAQDDEIAIAAPVLSQSQRLTTQDLLAVARTKSQDHLLAISSRPRVEESVTDVLVERGDRKVIHRLSGNAGAAFSEEGYLKLVERAEDDESLLEKIGSRLDIPLHFFRELLLRATSAVRERLLARAKPEFIGEIDGVLSLISDEVGRETIRSRTDAQRSVASLHQAGELDELMVLGFLRAGQQNEVVAAIALLCGANFELVAQVLQSDRNEAVLIPCKAAGFDWTIVRALLRSRPEQHGIVDMQMDQLRADYAKLSQPTAQRVLRFWLVRQSANVPQNYCVETAVAQLQSVRP